MYIYMCVCAGRNLSHCLNDWSKLWGHRQEAAAGKTNCIGQNNISFFECQNLERRLHYRVDVISAFKCVIGYDRRSR